MLSLSIDPEIARLFPSVKSGVVESGLWRIPLFFDKSFGKNRGCIRLRRYIVHMAEMGETKEAMMEKTNEIYEEFSRLIEKYPADNDTIERRKKQLDIYMIEFIDEVTELIAEGDATQIY
ncbi:MAG: hypothetical protein Q8N79_09860 [Candidatus Methanoperedens sp.]|nr:hypothetical protein [Candidatus Methanoperedens sp.]